MMGLFSSLFGKRAPQAEAGRPPDPGIDAVICGHNVPLLQKGRMVKNTVTSYRHIEDLVSRMVWVWMLLI